MDDLIFEPITTVHVPDLVAARYAADLEFTADTRGLLDELVAFDEAAWSAALVAERSPVA